MWTIEGRIIQQNPVFGFDLNLALQNRDKTVSKTIRVADRETRFQMISDSTPLKLRADPDVDIFRQLFPAEIPPAINSLKSSKALLVVLADDLEPDIRSAATMLLQSLGVENYTSVAESALDQKDVREKDVLIVGYPQRKPLFFKLPEQVAIKPQAFTLNQNTYDSSTDIFFGVFSHPHRRDRVTALFLPLSSSHADEVARKVTHYGKYSYLAFQKGLNRDKGFWSLGLSPLEYRWRDNPNTTSQNFTTAREYSVH
jgi:hypothetical protein